MMDGGWERLEMVPLKGKGSLGKLLAAMRPYVSTCIYPCPAAIPGRVIDEGDPGDTQTA